MRRSSSSAPSRFGRRAVLATAAVALATLTTIGVAAPAVASTIAPSVAALSEQAQRASDAAEAALQDADAVRSQVTSSGLTVHAQVSPDTTGELEDAILRLRPLDLSPAVLIPTLVDDVTAATDRVEQETEQTATALAAAKVKRNAEIDAVRAEVAATQAAAKAAAEKAAAEAAAAALAAANTPEGAKETARTMAADQFGWGENQFSCLTSLWQKESGWNYQAYNPSGATGIPQSLPGEKMASAGADWATNATTQIAWGLGYINSVYGSPCAAWGHSQATNWY